MHVKCLLHDQGVLGSFRSSFSLEEVGNLEASLCVRYQAKVLEKNVDYYVYVHALERLRGSFPSQCVPYTKSIMSWYICYNKGVKGVKVNDH